MIKSTLLLFCFASYSALAYLNIPSYIYRNADNRPNHSLMTASLQARPIATQSIPMGMTLQATALQSVWDTAYVDDQKYIDNRADSITISDGAFSGPGPYTVHFEAEINDNDITYWAWQIAGDALFEDIEVQYNDLLVDYEFRDTGTFYARFTTSNNDNTKETFGNVITITVTESLLEIPNVITPDSPTGNNKIFKVKYKSLRKFEIWVYNRWGNQLFHSSNPEIGWDGSYKGKTVPTGAYYYLVKAVGTDDIKYEKKGDINVLRLKNSGSYE